MFALNLLLPLSFLFVLAIGVALWWAIFSGQFDDVERHGTAILQDDDATMPGATPGWAQEPAGNI